MTVALEVVAEHIRETRKRDREDASEVLSSMKRRRPAKKRAPDDR